MSEEREAVKRAIQGQSGHFAFFPQEWNRVPLDVKEKPTIDETALERHRAIQYGSPSPRNKFLKGEE